MQRYQDWVWYGCKLNFTRACFWCFQGFGLGFQGALECLGLWAIWGDKGFQGFGLSGLTVSGALRAPGRGPLVLSRCSISGVGPSRSARFASGAGGIGPQHRQEKQVSEKLNNDSNSSKQHPATRKSCPNNSKDKRFRPV